MKVDPSDFRILIEQLAPFHPVRSASLISGLLTQPSLHANTIRLEMLVHILFAFSTGKREPKVHEIGKWLNADLGSTMLASMEDPIEDVFISNVTSEVGNSRVFEGIWESSDFYLQRVLNVIKTLPEDENTNQLKREVQAILRLSEEISTRRGLPRFYPGGGVAKGEIRGLSPERLKILQRSISFSSHDLQRLGISSTDLAPYVFPSHSRHNLRNQVLGNTDLERRPLVYNGGKWIVLLPTAISVAVRRYIFEWMHHHGYHKSFDRQLVMEYQKFLHEIPILGSWLPREMTLPSKEVGDKTVLDVVHKVEVGRFLHLLICVDSLEGYAKCGFAEPDLDITEVSNEIALRVQRVREHFRKEKHFKQGLTLLIGCGYGRPSAFIPPNESHDWRVECVSAPDLQSLAWVPGASPLFLWKLVDHERFLAEHGISIANANGLLNLYGWWSDSNFLMLDHRLEFGGDPIHLVIPTNCLVEVRKKVRRGWDVHALPLPDGRFVVVRRKDAESFFPGEAETNFYVDFDSVSAGQLLGAWVGERLIWWVSAEHSNTELPHEPVYRTWDLVSNWMERAVPILEKQVRTLRIKTVLIALDFNDVHQDQISPTPEPVLRSCISVSIDHSNKTIRIRFSDPFFGGFRNPKNVAERTILRKLAIGVLQLAGETPDDATLDTLINEIVPNDDARYLHFFEAIYFRDYIQTHDRPEKLFIDDSDVARSKLGLGWLVQDRKSGDKFTTAEQSGAFLNKVVVTVWERMRTRLHKLNRIDIIEQALRYIEGAEDNKTRWQRTIRAVLSLHNDKVSTKVIAMNEIARSNASELSLRLVIEMALSECPLESGDQVGTLDLTPLMSDALMIFHLGGFSDAIKKGVMEPEVRIAPSGDVLCNLGFLEDVANQLGKHFESVRLDHESAQYEGHYQSREPVLTVKGKISDDFLIAFEAEFGFSVDGLRSFRDALANLAVEKKQCVFSARKDEILSYCTRKQLVSEEIGTIMLRRLALWPRKSWNQTPDGFKGKDWYPWRFGRRLSLLARPLVQLEESDNPRYLISPGLMGVGIELTLSRYHNAEADPSDCQSVLMKQWIDQERNRRGHAFASSVFEVMKTNGYEARLEEKVGSLLNERLDRDYGDIDVLAWKKGGDEVLAIECKNLEMAKTPNEIAEQLNRFSGQTLPNGKPDDLLKHLDRCALLKDRSRRLAQMIGIANRDIRIQTVVCFSKPVPMLYVTKRFPDVTFLTVTGLIKESIPSQVQNESKEE